MVICSVNILDFVEVLFVSLEQFFTDETLYGIFNIANLGIESLDHFADFGENSFKVSDFSRFHELSDVRIEHDFPIFAQVLLLEKLILLITGSYLVSN